MIPWQELDRTRIPDSDATISLHRRGTDFSIRCDGLELMNSRAHGSEDALAELTCARVASRRKARVLVGGLGMGFTLAKTLRQVGPDAEVVLAELVPSVVAWNHTHLAHLAGEPLRDTRVIVRELDVGRVLREQAGAFDAILLDVDNGPEGLAREANDWLYGSAGLAAAHRALREQGVLSVWSASPDRRFGKRLQRAGFTVEEKVVRARDGSPGGNKGAKQLIWLATRALSAQAPPGAASGKAASKVEAR